MKDNQTTALENQNIEIQLILEAIYLKYGFDFRNYGKSHVKRRILRRLSLSGMKTLSEMQARILSDHSFFKTVLNDLSINVTEMFRDPSFYIALRKEVIPILKTYPFTKIWHAGCATGEEVYSMAILLKEEGLYERSQIYATDFNEVILRKAREARYPIHAIREYTCNYQKSGGMESFADYYAAKNGSAVIADSIKKNVIFSDHNLVTDGVFGEMHLIMCRNVLIYFNKELQSRVLGLFRDSLCRNGFLCLGSKESPRFSKYKDYFKAAVNRERIYQKKN